jgi:hypothetical protein
MENLTETLLNAIRNRFRAAVKRRALRQRTREDRKTHQVERRVTAFRQNRYKNLLLDPSQLSSASRWKISQKPKRRVSKKDRKIIRAAKSGLGEFEKRERVEWFKLMQEYQLTQLVEYELQQAADEQESDNTENDRNGLSEWLTQDSAAKLQDVPVQALELLQALLRHIEKLIKGSPTLFASEKKRLQQQCNRLLATAIGNKTQNLSEEEKKWLEEHPEIIFDSILPEIEQICFDERTADTISRAILRTKQDTGIQTINTKRSPRDRIEEELHQITTPIRLHFLKLASQLNVSDLVRADWTNHLTVRFLARFEEELLSSNPTEEIDWESQFSPLVNTILKELKKTGQMISHIPNSTTAAVLTKTPPKEEAA